MLQRISWFHLLNMKLLIHQYFLFFDYLNSTPTEKGQKKLFASWVTKTWRFKRIIIIIIKWYIKKVYEKAKIERDFFKVKLMWYSMLILPKWKKNHCRKQMQIKMQKSSDFFHIFKKIFLILRKTRSKFGVLLQIIYREKRLGIKPPFWEKKLFQ